VGGGGATASKYFFPQPCSASFFKRIFLSKLQHVQLRTCKGVFYISETTGPIAFKFGMSLETDELGGFHMFIGVVMSLCTCARAYDTPLPYHGNG
jgi:hypothetical protein